MSPDAIEKELKEQRLLLEQQNNMLAQIAALLGIGKVPPAKVIDLKARAMKILEAWGEVPGYAIKESAGNRKWMNEAATAADFKALGYDYIGLYTLCSPAQAEKIIKAEKGLKPKEVKAILEPMTIQGRKKSLVKTTKQEVIENGK